MATQFRGPIGFRLAHELEGLLRGIAADGVINASETRRLEGWLAANRGFAHIAPFAELSHQVERALADGVLTSDEVEDLLFVVCKLTTVNPFFDQLRSGVQQLMGILTGVSADSVLNAAEISNLQQWLDQWAHLRGLWPYDECEAVVTHIVAANRLTEDARYVFSLAQEFPVAGAAQDVAAAPLLISGVCAVDPTIMFPDRMFVFTGESRKGERRHLVDAVTERQGRTYDKVTKDIDFLVVCDNGSQHWAFSCYGRKVEKAYNLRRGGHHVQIVAERDFWDAMH